MSNPLGAPPSWGPVDPGVMVDTGAIMQMRLRDTLLRALSAAWLTAAPYNRPEATRFAAQAAALDRGSVYAQATATATTLNQTLAAKTSGSVAASATSLTVPAPLEVTDLRPGVDPQELWLRPFVYLWWRLGQGDTPAQAQRKGLNRAQNIGLTNLQLAKTHTARAVLLAHPDAVAYRRITRGDTSCDLCTTQLGPYPASYLMPIHPLCSCDIDPLTSVPGHVAPESPVEHTEIGPVLATGGTA